MATERRVVIWTTSERKGQPWFINHYDKRDEPAREITEEDIHRYLCPHPKKEEVIRIPVQAQFVDSKFLTEIWIDLRRVSDLDFEVTYQINNVIMPVMCFVADEVEWSDHDRLTAWDKIDVGQIHRRIEKARAYHRMPLAQFERKVTEQPIDTETDEYERRNRLPPLQYWRAVAKALGVSSQWLIQGVDMLDIDRAINSINYR